jgi:hypothetical protein
MGPGMNMNSGGSESVSGRVQPAKPDHFTSQMEMAVDRAEQATEPEIGVRATPGPPQNLSPCAHEACSHFSVSPSPPSGDHYLPDALGWVAVDVVPPVHLSAGIHRMGFGTSPPEIREADCLTTILRI